MGSEYARVGGADARLGCAAGVGDPGAEGCGGGAYGGFKERVSSITPLNKTSVQSQETCKTMSWDWTQKRA